MPAKLNEFKEDVLQPGRGEEPKDSSNAGLSLALIVTVVLVVLLAVWALNVPHLQYYNKDGQAIQPNVPSPTTPNAASRERSKQFDYVDGVPVQGDAGGEPGGATSK